MNTAMEMSWDGGPERHPGREEYATPVHRDRYEKWVACRAAIAKAKGGAE